MALSFQAGWKRCNIARATQQPKALSSPENVDKGQRASVMCQVMHGVRKMRKAIAAGNLEGATHIFLQRAEAALQGDFRSGTDMCDMLLVICGRTGDVELATKLLDRMVTVGMPCGRVAHNSMIFALCNTGRIQEAAEHLLMKVPQTTVTTAMYNQVLRNCAHTGNVDLFKECLQYMMTKGIDHDEDTWVERLRISGQQGEGHVAECWKDYLSASACVGYKASCARVMALQRCGSAEATSLAVREMADNIWHELAGDDRKAAKESLLKAFNAAICAAERSSRHDLVKSLLLQMRNWSIQPDIYTYNSLHRTMAKTGGSSADSEVLLQEMREHGVIPNDHSFAQLLQRHSDAGDCEGAEKAWQRMQAAGPVLDELVLQLLSLTPHKELCILYYCC
ncbi:unnamed protein product [Ostreobium quekettii]|uniref:Pentacotripeptide-repeat region of PRORP domain-containing protein n=1 Tax=Ostreobium quekettii TaxID=121088 RepID=A0A8S1IT22_9CHLO|nr:unnamed protein product [Ostreobium quekettii]